MAARKTAKKTATKKSASKKTRASRPPATSSEPEVLLKVREIVRVLEASRFEELEYEDDDMSLKISRSTAVASAPLVDSGTVAAPTYIVPSAPPAPAPPAATTEAPAATEASDESLHVVRSPFVGTFYEAPSPDADPFVAVGDRVQAGQTLCIVEAMKLMNEIEADATGTIREILVGNGKAVQFDDPLFRIEVD